jgi:hypothetical protein
MLQISELAKEILKDSLDQASHETGDVYRLVVMEDRLGLSLGKPEDGDVVYEANGEAILALPPELASRLDSTIDIDETAEGPRLVLVT